MTPSQASHSSSSLLRKHPILLGLSLFVGVLLLAFLYTLWQVLQLYQTVRAGELAPTTRSIQVLHTIGAIAAPKVFGDTYLLAPARFLPRIFTDSYGISLQLAFLANQQFSERIDLRPLFTYLTLLEEDLLAARAYFAAHPRILSAVEKKYPTVNTDLELLLNGLAAANEASKVTGHWLILFQNSDELRATGGFMGSYMLIELDAGVIKNWVVEDIYDADGQFAGYVEAPPGVKEYLSSNRGLRLPDANWEADFPQSAQQILQFFALGSRSNIVGVTTINLQFAEQLLAITGPVSLPDYEGLITADSLSTMLRSERDDFFAGNVQKKHILTQLITQLQLRFSALSQDQFFAIASLLKQAIANQDIQAYSIQEKLQDHFEKLDITGSIAIEPETNPVLIVESNVGINKANRLVDRTITIDHKQDKLHITIKFNNKNLSRKGTALSELAPATVENAPSNQAPHNGYVNYQRILTLPSWNIAAATVDGVQIPIESTRIIKTTNGTDLVEYGMLLRIPEQTQSELQLELINDNPAQSNYPVVFFRQSGIPENAHQLFLLNK